MSCDFRSILIAITSALGHVGPQTAINEAVDCVLIHVEIRRSRRGIEQRFVFKLALHRCGH